MFTDQILEFRAHGGRKHMNRVQFLELFDFIEAAFKGTTLNKRTNKKNNVFLGGKGSQEVPETI